MALEKSLRNSALPDTPKKPVDTPEDAQDTAPAIAYDESSSTPAHFRQDSNDNVVVQTNQFQKNVFGPVHYQQDQSQFSKNGLDIQVECTPIVDDARNQKQSKSE